MTLEALGRWLRARYDRRDGRSRSALNWPPIEFSPVNYRLTMPEGWLSFTADERSLEFADRDTPRTLTVYFDSLDTAFRVLSGQLDPRQAFIEGRFKSDGHIVLAMGLPLLFR